MKLISILAAVILLGATCAYAEKAGAPGSSWSLDNLWRGALIGAIIGYFAGRKWKSR